MTEDEGKWGKSRFPKEYQARVGWNAREVLHNNSKELKRVLQQFNLPEDNMKVFEIGAGGARNLYYIWELNNTIKLYANDLFEDASREQMNSQIKDKVVFYEKDTIDLVNEETISDIDIFLTSDHLMHLDYEPVKTIIQKVRDEWKPKYIMIRECTKKHEEDYWPRLYHDYDAFNKSYDVLYDDSSKGSDAKYRVLLFRRKND